MLEESGIPATYLGSAQQKNVEESIRRGDYRLVYVTPETFFDQAKRQPRKLFLELSKENRLCVVAIDEAHLISSWKSFR